jgi:arginase
VHIQPIGVPYDLNRHAARMGLTPAALLPRLAALGEQVAAPVLVQADGLTGDELADVGRVAGALAAEVRAARDQHALPLIIGGDCTVALGALAGLADGANGVIWIDAHGDFNTPATSPSSYLGGMPLAAVVGRGLPELRAAAGLVQPIAEERVALLGVRDLDPLERAALDASSVTVASSATLREDGKSLMAALRELCANGPIYLHIDVDVLDPNEMPGVVYPTPDGLRLNELRRVLREISQTCGLAAVALTAVNLEPLDEPTRALVLERALLLIQEIAQSRVKE